jgi:LysR family nitrogen assimilation transcriptional regulator
MQFRQLRYFIKIFDAGSFSRAASVVHVAQPALRQQIAEFTSLARSPIRLIFPH